ncbi:hypothetical protein ACI1BE_003607 [Cronobacter turicensis]|uniref:hypothetical protein n=1 Tax=Cronobacter turicensis TaxID=413502 RepID=UPI003570BCCC
MDSLGQFENLERIELIAKYFCVEESSARERQIALLWINELVETMRHGVNTLQMMLDTIDLLAQLASQCASHSHPGTGGPTTAAAFSQTAAQSTQTRSRYESIIA